MTDYPTLRERAEAHGQGHLFQFWEELDAPSRESLSEDVAAIDFALLKTLVDRWLLHPPAPEHFSKVEAVPLIAPVPGRDDADARAALEAGEGALRQGKVGVFLVAGGQGTRLGFGGPKGAYPIGPLTGKSFFAYHAEKILNLQRHYGAVLPWYIMVSRENAAATHAYFAEQNYFALDAGQIFFVEQQMMPCVDAQGKILLHAKDVVCMNPNGHGGCIPAIGAGALLADAQARGIEYLSYFQVDNWAAKVIDPYFVGYHILRGAEMSSKVHLKTTPRESVGVHCLCDGEYRIIEYSELDLYPQLLAVDDEGAPLLNAGNPAMHILSLDFVADLADKFCDFPWHLAHKKIPHINAQGHLIQPHEANGYKFETFVFDALRYTRHEPVALVINKAGEYTPVKHFEGSNSVVAARKQMSDYWAQWLEAAGVEITRDDDGACPHMIEISPAFALTLEEFVAKANGLPKYLEQSLTIDAKGNVALDE